MQKLDEEEIGFFFWFFGRGANGYFLLQKLKEEEDQNGFYSFAKSGGEGEHKMGFSLLQKLEEEEDKMGFFVCKNWKRRRIKIAEKSETIIKTGKCKTQATKKKGKTHVQTALVMTEICYREKETVAEGSLTAEEEEEEEHVKNQSLHNRVTTVATSS